MRRSAAHLVIALTIGLLAAAAPVLAQDPAESAAPPSVICGVLTLDEIAAAFGDDLPVTSSDAGSCTWASYATGGNGALSLTLAPGTLDDLRSAYPDATDEEIAGVPVLVGSDGTFLFAEASGGVLSVFAFVFDDSVDVPAAVRTVTEAALGRIGSVELPPTPTQQPQPSFMGDAELQALMPTTVGGQPLESQTFSGQDLAAQIDPEDPDDQAEFQTLVDALAAQGRTLDDLSAGFAYYSSEDSSGGLTAVRVRGLDIDAFVDDLLPLLVTGLDDPQRTPGQVAGRDVTIVTDGPDGPDASRQYVYPKGEILWVVVAEEPALTELFDQLP